MTTAYLKTIAKTRKEMIDIIKRANRELFAIETMMGMHELETGKFTVYKNAKSALRAIAPKK